MRSVITEGIPRAGAPGVGRATMPATTTRSPLAIAHGTFAIVNGLWPLVAMRSFEAIFGPKVDRWLVYTVGGLLCTVGITQVRAGLAGDTATGRLLGVGTATTLLAIDTRYAPSGRISRMYLLDAVCEIAWSCAWLIPGLRSRVGGNPTGRR